MLDFKLIVVLPYWNTIRSIIILMIHKYIMAARTIERNISHEVVKASYRRMLHDIILLINLALDRPDIIFYQKIAFANF